MNLLRHQSLKNTLFLLISLTAIVILLGFNFAQSQINSKATRAISGEISFRDSSWNDLHGQYPIGSDSIYIRVIDSDMDIDSLSIDSVEVMVASEFGDDESMTLYETNNHVGIFQGSIALDPQSTKFITWVKDKYAGEFEQKISSNAIKNEWDIWSGLKNANIETPGDNYLQIIPGDSVVAIYIDLENEGSTLDTLIEKTFYGMDGYSGSISGTWSSDQSPYTVIGDVQIDNGDTLIIEEGVEVRLLPDVSFIVNSNAHLQINGDETDSVYFTARVDNPESSDYWGGILGYGKLEMSFTAVTYAQLGVIASTSYNLGGSVLSHCYISDCGGLSYYQVALSVNDSTQIADCQIINNPYSGIAFNYGAGSIIQTEVSYNGLSGLYLYGCIVQIDSVLITNNTGDGIYIASSNYPDRLPIIHNSDIYDNAGYDIFNASAFDIDAKYNWWGDSTTAEMNLGGNPKNILKIYDTYDSTSVGMVNYSHWEGGLGGGVTGTITFVDSLWTDLAPHYAFESDSLFVEVYDPDVDTDELQIDSLVAIIESEYGDSETLYLYESDIHTGIFHGTLAFDPQVVKFAAWLKSQNLELNSINHTEDYTLRELILQDWDIWQSNNLNIRAIDDGLLQIKPGNFITGLYYDQYDDWANIDTLTAEAVFGGYGGSVAGTWSTDESPYVIVSDITVENDSTLIIEAGVEIQLMPDVSIIVENGGYLQAQGAESDTVIFTTKRVLPDTSEYWGGIIANYSGGRLVFTYAIVKYARYGLSTNTHSSYGGSSLSHCLIRDCGTNQYSRALDMDYLANISNCIIVDNMGYGLLHSGEGNINNTEISNNYYGIYLGYFAGSVSNISVFDNIDYGIYVDRGTPVLDSVLVNNNGSYGIDIYRSIAQLDSIIVSNNGSYGIRITSSLSYPGIIPTIHNCDIYDNTDFDIFNNGEQDINAKYNWWGDSTTAEMNLGGNPKNISRIFDSYDSSTIGSVNYSCWVDGTDCGNTGIVTFKDSLWNEIGINYPYGTDSAMLEVEDIDRDVDSLVVDTVEIIMASDYGDSEALYLHETDVHTGIFRGSIAFDPQVTKFIAWFKDKYPDIDEVDFKEDKYDLLQKEWDVWENMTGYSRLAIDDGLFQVRPGNSILATYIDTYNEWGNEDTLSTEMIYGGLAGNVAGTWTVDNSPYVIVGDVYVDYDSTLIIEAGVEVQLMPDVSISVGYGGYLQVLGTESDSVVFTAKATIPGIEDYWGGLNPGGSQGRLDISYASIKFAQTGIRTQTYFSYGRSTISHCHISDCGTYSNSIALYVDDSADVVDCVIMDNMGCGLRHSGEGSINNTEISNNNYGIYLYYFSGSISRVSVFNNTEYGIYAYRGAPVLDSVLVSNNGSYGIDINISTAQLDSVQVSGNGSYGIRVGSDEYYPDGIPLINNCEIYDNTAYDIYNNGVFDINAKNNWWGDSTTAEMNLGGNPKNIIKIYDQYDNSNVGLINYSCWIGGADCGNTGILAFKDSMWIEIDEHYPSGSDSAFIEVVDIDQDSDSLTIDTVQVTLESEYGDLETLTLYESDIHTGVFHGSIPFDPQVVKFVSWLKDKYPGGIDSEGRQEIVDKEWQFWQDKEQNPVFAAEDGMFQVKPGNEISAIYIDLSNEWSSEDTVTAVTIYGGQSGSVSGIWTAASSPYVVVGDISIDTDSSLVIEAGVEVRFMPAVSLNVFTGGTLQALGSESDSVFFTTFSSQPDTAEYWGFINSSSSSHRGRIDMSYAVLEYSEMGVHTYTQAVVGGSYFSHCRVSNCGSTYYSESFSVSDSIEVEDCQINNNNEYGIVVSGSGIVNNTVISGNTRSGIYLDYYTGLVSNVTVTDNSGHGIDIRRGQPIIDSVRSENNDGDGIYIYNSPTDIDSAYITGNGSNGIRFVSYSGSVYPSINNSSIYGNSASEYDFYNDSEIDIDARYNWWGDSTTAEMNLGGNPKNIIRIYDQFDYSNLGEVNYSCWVNGTGCGATGEITFKDSAWNDITIQYPGGSDSAFFEVIDADININESGIDSLEITLESEYGDIENLFIMETNINTGIFHGSMAFDPQVAKFMAWLKENYSERINIDWKSENGKEILEAWDTTLANNNIEKRAIEDDLLQIRPGNWLKITYIDLLNDYGNPDTISMETIYGGYSGSVAGTWTVTGSPYVIVGDISIDNYDTLTVEAGVEIQFLPDVSFNIEYTGCLNVMGVESDSVLFTTKAAVPDTLQYWAGLNTGYNSGKLNLSYTIIEYAYEGLDIRTSSYYHSEAIISHCRISSCGNSNYSNYAINLDSDVPVYVLDCEISNNHYTGLNIYYTDGLIARTYSYNNNGIGIWLKYSPVEITESFITNNIGDGLRIENSDALIHFTKITNNGSYGVRISSYDPNDVPAINYCEIHDNSPYDIYNDCSYGINAENNFWGDLTTAEMMAGPYPQNITVIYDSLDYSYRGIVDYDPWSSDTVDLESPEIVWDTTLIPQNGDFITQDSANFGWTALDNITSQDSILYSLCFDSVQFFDWGHDTTYSGQDTTFWIRDTLSAVFIGLTEGFHVFKLNAKDDVGLIATDSICFAVDTTSPTTIVLSGPEDSSMVPYLTVEFVWTGSDNISNSANLQYSYKIDDSDYTSFSYDTSHAFILDEGDHAFTIKARDEAGNEELTPIITNFTVGTLDIDFVTAPYEGEVIRVDSVVFAWIATDSTTPPDSINYSYSLDGAEFSEWNRDTMFVATGLDFGSHTFTVKAQGLTNYIAIDSITFSVDIGPHSGIVAFKDSLWNDINTHYPAGSDSVYTEVVDADMDRNGDIIDSLEVTLESTYGDIESLYLFETGINTGVFHGAMSFDVQAVKFVSWFEKNYPQGIDPDVENEIFEGIREEWEAWQNETLFSKLAPGDNILQVSTMDSLVVTYQDSTDDWGNPSTQTDTIMYGGYSGAVSGIWTTSESPYIIVGDIIVQNYDTLIIQAGVELRFMPNASLHVDYYGFLEALGNVSDSIYFTTVADSPNPSEYWGGINTMSTGGRLNLSYSVLTFAKLGIRSYTDSYLFGSQFSNCLISECGSYSSSYSALDLEDSANVIDCQIVNNPNHGLRFESSGIVTGTNISNNGGNGIYIYSSNSIMFEDTCINNGNYGIYSYYSKSLLDGVIVTGNSSYGIYVNSASYYPERIPTINNCDIYDNDISTNYDLYNAGELNLNAKFNWWGDSVTAEMNLGGNPKNISSIYDIYDNSSYGEVNYSCWVGGPSCDTSVTGSVVWMDSLFIDSISNYPPESDSAFVEVVDADLDIDSLQLDSVEVMLESEFGDLENIYLFETDSHTGVFHGSIAFDPQVAKFVKWLRERYPDISIADSSIEFKEQVRGEWETWTSLASKNALAPGDNLLQVEPGSSILVTYIDLADEFGAIDTLTDTSIFGGYSGYVSGTWTEIESPYVIVGDIIINSNDTLIIEAGVEVLFLPDVSFSVNSDGYLQVIGNETDSVYFRTKIESPEISDYWGGINLWWASGRLNISYAVITHNLYGVYAGTPSNHGGSTLSNCRISNCCSQPYLYDAAVTIENYGDIYYCLISDNIYNGITFNAIGSIQNSRLSNNNNGIEVTGDSVFISHVTSTNNDYRGIYISGSNTWIDSVTVTNNNTDGIYISSAFVHIDSATIINNIGNGIRSNSYATSPEKITIIHNSELYDNGNYDFYNSGELDVDAKYNWWGDSTTAVMNLGGNPKNISVIYDQFDNSSVGEVNYSCWIGGSSCGETGSIALKDSLWEDIDLHYPAGSDSLYIEVVDSDMDANSLQQDSLIVTLEGEFGDFESIYIYETSVNSGIFHGSIAFDLQAVKFVSWLREAYPNGLDQENIDTQIEQIKKEWETWLTEKLGKSTFSPQDKQLQINPGEIISATYVDSLSDYGSIESLTTQTIYGGYAGSIAGTWTSAESPYFIVGDVFIDYDSSLVIEAGVEVRLLPNVSFTVNSNGNLEVNGTYSDSVFFTTKNILPDTSDYWGGINPYPWSSTGQMSLSYTVINNNRIGTYSSTPVSQGGSVFSHCIISNCGNQPYYFDAALYIEDSAEINDCQVNNNSASSGIQLGGSGSISRTEITNNDNSGLYLVNYAGTVSHVSVVYNNGYGIRLESGTPVLDSVSVLGNGNMGIYFDNSPAVLTRVLVTNNGNFGLCLFSYDPSYVPIITNSEFHDNTSYDFYNMSQYNIDAQYNYWGDSTTAIMNLGGNPKDIGAIYDYYDNSSLGTVLYHPWDSIAPDHEPPIIVLDSTLIPQNGDHITIDSALFAWIASDNVTQNDSIYFSFLLDSIQILDWGDTITFLDTLTMLDTIYWVRDTLNLTINNLAEGYHRFNLRAMDHAGLIADSLVNFYEDFTPPNTHLVNGPSDSGWINSDSVFFAWVGSDGITDTTDLLYAYKIDTDPFSSFDTITSISYSGLSEGEHTFEVKARDLAGHEDATPLEINFAVDLIDPTTEIVIAPPDSSWITTDSLTIYWTGNDDRTPVEELLYSYRLDSSSYSAFMPDTFFTFTDLSDNLHIIEVRARDLAGNIDTTPASVLFYIDVTGPNITVTSPSDGEHYNDSSIEATWTADDMFTHPDSIQYAYNFDSLGYSDWSYDTSLSLDDLTEGFHYLNIKAIDHIGNIEEVTSVFAVDFTNPNTSVVSSPPDGGWATSSDVSFCWSGSDNLTGSGNLTYAYSMDGEPYSVFGSATCNTFLDLSEGSHTFLVKSRDKAENEDESPDSVSFELGLVDLVPTALTIPDDAITYNPLEISWTVENIGTGPARKGWRDRLWLSSDEIFGDDEDLGYHYHNDTLWGGQSQIIIDTVNLPLAEGNYWFFVEVDYLDIVNEEDAESNNILLSSSPCSLWVPPHPDLIVTDVVVPDSGMTGRSVSVQWTVTNTGNDLAYGPWQEKLSLSNDSIIGGDDYIEHFTYSGSLEPGSSYVHIHPLPLPENEPGEYWLVVESDDYNNVNEYYEENNNIGISDSSIIVEQSPYPDLTITTVIAPDSATSGQSTGISWTTTNIGNAATNAPVWYDKVYLSVDTVFNESSDVSLGYFRNFSYLASGQSYVQDTIVTIPWELSGNYYFLVIADYSDLLVEHSGEDNNVGFKSTSTNVAYVPEPKPCLEVVLDQSPANAWAGEPITVSWTVTNIGNATASGHWLVDWVMLSTDPNPQSGDLHIGPYYTGAALLPDSSYSRTGTFSLPEGLNGNYYLFVWTDVRLEYPVCNNFTTPVPLSISPNPPVDLEVTSITISQDTINSGSVIDVSWTVTNQTIDSTFYKTWTDGIYISSDTILDIVSDSLMATQNYTGNLLGEQSYSKVATLTIPNELSGPYYFIISTDINNNISEGIYENNNDSPSSLLEVQYTPPDLRFASLIPPDSAFSGMPASIEWTVTNLGPGRTAVTEWQDRIYLSADDQLDLPGDIELKDQPHVGALDPDSTYTVIAYISIPNGYDSTFHLIAVTDANGDVFEDTLDSNNTAATTFDIDLTPPPDLQVVDLTTPDTAIAGLTTVVEWVVTNSGDGVTSPNNWKDRLYLSSNSSNSVGGDTELLEQEHNGALSVGATYSTNRDVVLPDVPAGSYYLKAMTDANDDVYEHLYNSNNILAIPLHVTKPDSNDLRWPNLAVTEVTSNDTAIAGDTATISWAVVNTRQFSTPSSPNSWYDAIYLSPTNVLDTSIAMKIEEVTHMGILPAGSTYVSNRLVMMPDGVLGTYYLFVLTDKNDKLDETDENDNSLGIPITMQLLSPDLVVATVIVPDSIKTGQKLSLSWGVQNVGVGDTKIDEWFDAAYLSPDHIIDETDHLLVSVKREGFLLADSVYAIDTSVITPSGVTGTFYVIVETDKNDNVYESIYEDNNYLRTSDVLEIFLPEPVNLVIDSVTIPDSAFAGDEVNISWTVSNTEPNNVTGQWIDAVYLSEDSVWDYTDPLIGTVDITAPLKGGGKYRGSVSVRASDLFAGDLEKGIPGVVPGNYRIIVRTDIRNVINEVDETDNTSPSTDSMTIDVYELLFDTPYTDSISQEQMHYFRVEMDGESDLRINFSATSPIIQAELFIQYNKPPNRAVYDASSYYIGEENCDMVVSATIPGTYYIMLYGSNVLSSSAEYELLVREVSFEIIESYPSIGGNAGELTLELQGSRLHSGVSVKLLKNGDTMSTAHRVYSPFSSLLFATFDLTMIPTGDYDILIEYEHVTYSDSDSLPDTTVDVMYVTKDTATLENALTVVSAQTPSNSDIQVSLQMPGAVRIGQSFLIKALYKNLALNDVSAPLLSLRSSCPISLYVDTTNIHFGTQYDFLGLSDMEYKYTLRPGITEEVTWHVEYEGSESIEINLAPLDQNSLNGPNFSIYIDSLGLNIELSEKQGLIITLDSIYGSTWADYEMGLINVSRDNAIGDVTKRSAKRLLLSSMADYLHTDDTTGPSPSGFSSLPYLFDGKANNSIITDLNDEWIGHDFRSSHTFPDRGSDWFKECDCDNESQMDKYWNFMNWVAGRFRSFFLWPDAANHLEHLLDNSGKALFYFDGDRITEQIREGSDKSYNSFPKLHKSVVSAIKSNIRSTIQSEYDENGAGSYSIDHETLLSLFSGNPGASPLNFYFDSDGTMPTWTKLGNTIAAFGAMSGVSYNVQSLGGTITESDCEVIASCSGTIKYWHNDHYIFQRYKNGRELIYPNWLCACLQDCGEASTFNVMVEMSQSFDPFDIELSYSGDEKCDPPDPPSHQGDNGVTTPVSGRDPNEKIGPLDVDGGNMVAGGDLMHYTVLFENMPDASAPAVDVTINDQLDTLLDWRKFRLGEIAFGDSVIVVPGSPSYWHTTVNLDSLGLLLEIDAGINAFSGEAHWYFNTIDPNTGQPPVDPYAGFLPPNDSTGRGEGHVTFTIKSDVGLQEGTEIKNKATIVFDINDAIVTNEVVNVIYNPKPDLIVSSASVQSGSTTLITWQPSYFVAEIKNQGENSSGDFYMMVLVDSADTAVLIDSVLVNSLSSGQTREVDFIWTPTFELDTGYISFYADYSNSTAELDETNNSRSLQISIRDDYVCGDVYEDGIINVLDIGYLINYLYKGGPPPDPLIAGNVDGLDDINILDIVYLISFKYLGGPPPDCEAVLPRLFAANEPGSIECIVKGGKSIITVNTPVDLYGLELVIDVGSNSTAGVKNLLGNLELFSFQKESELKIGLLDIKGKQKIAKGETRIIEITGKVEIIRALGGDRNAQRVDFKINNTLLPDVFELRQNYPNPFNPTTVIAFTLPEAVHVELEIFNVLGQRVTTLVDDRMEAGYHNIKWNSTDSHGNEIATGVYFYRIKAGNFVKSKKMVLLK